jgi:DNA adenine methylase
MATKIVQVLGKHKSYWEPFCGSMAVLFAKEPSSYETVNDLHGDLINLARVVQDDNLAPRLYAKTSRTLCCEQLFRDTVKQWRTNEVIEAPEEPDLDRAYQFFIVSWLGMNGLAGAEGFHQGFAIRYTGNGGSPTVRFRSAVESIPAWHHRLRGVMIANKDAFAMLPKIEDTPTAVIYVDPPYLSQKVKYAHHFTREQHGQLARELRRFTNTRVVVSYYDDPQLEELYPGWGRIDCTLKKGLVSGAKREANNPVRAPEVLLVNSSMNVALFQ